MFLDDTRIPRSIRNEPADMKPFRHRLAAVLTLLFAFVGAAQAQTASLHSPYGFDETLARVERAIDANGMFKIATASASRAAAGLGIAIPGDAVVLIFRNDFARRILAADPTAGVEAPLPIHISETKTGTVIAWKRPSDVYGPYPAPEVARVARELDAIFAKIAADALIP
ncbi:MAG: hypothetical protein C6Y20_16000 [Tagaea sp. CACIAM 22H2]|nr:hypothetical protein [Tagaea sp. CACIAM 22H2]